DEQLDVLVALAEYASSALQAAQERASAVSHRGELERLLHASSLLTETTAVESLLQSVCDGIRGALGFETVTADLVDGESDEFVSLLDPAFEVEGCFLVPADQVRLRLGASAASASGRNGRGPHAWT